MPPAVRRMHDAEHIANGKPDRIVKDHQALRSFAAVASVCLGWNADQAGQSFSLNVLNLGSCEIDVKRSKKLSSAPLWGGVFHLSDLHANASSFSRLRTTVVHGLTSDSRSHCCE